MRSSNCKILSALTGRISHTIDDKAVPLREDFWISTSNKQLNFVPHIYTLLKIDGRAGMVVPDNVLFEGGAGEKVRRNLIWRAGNSARSRLLAGFNTRKSLRHAPPLPATNTI
jgi:type I restriction enzyme M protein